MMSEEELLSIYQSGIQTICLELSALKSGDWESDNFIHNPNCTKEFRNRVIDKNVELLNTIPMCCTNDVAVKINIVTEYIVNAWFYPKDIHPQNDAFTEAWDNVYVREINKLINTLRKDQEN